MLVIRLRRIGRKHDPHYRLVVTEHTAPVQGKFLAEVGHYHPKSKELEISTESFMSWIEKGAKPSNTVSKLALKAGLTHKHIAVIERHAKPKSAPKESAAPATEAPAETASTDTTTVVTDETEAAPTEEVAESVEPASVESPEEAEASETPAETSEVTDAA